MPLKLCLYQHTTFYIMTSSRRVDSMWKAVMQSRGSLLQASRVRKDSLNLRRQQATFLDNRFSIQIAKPHCPHNFSASAYGAQSFSAAAQSGSATQPRRQRLGQVSYLEYQSQGTAEHLTQDSQTSSNVCMSKCGLLVSHLICCRTGSRQMGA